MKILDRDENYWIETGNIGQREGKYSVERGIVEQQGELLDREEIVDSEGIYWIGSGHIGKRGGIMDRGEKALTARRNTGQRGEILDSEGNIGQKENILYREGK